MLTLPIAIIGTGHMGTSLLTGLISNGYPADKLWVTDLDTNKLKQIHDQFNVHTTEDNSEAVKQADIVLIAVKPQNIANVVREIADEVQRKKPLIISIAAGICEKSIQQWLGGNIAIVRAMPNTPALIKAGATALYANPYVSKQQHDIAETILRSVGVVVWIQDEKWMDVITALSGSGPAYFFLVMETLRDAAIELGLPKETAQLLTLQTAYGAARMALESDMDVIELRRRVTSPGGTTEAAIHCLKQNHMDELFKNALSAAKKRSEELANIT